MEPDLRSQVWQGIAIFLLTIAASAVMLLAFYLISIAAEPIIELYQAELSSYRPKFSLRH